VCLVLHCSAGPQAEKRKAKFLECQLTGPRATVNHLDLFLRGHTEQFGGSQTVQPLRGRIVSKCHQFLQHVTSSRLMKEFFTSAALVTKSLPKNLHNKLVIL
jgi:hypothetical protein